MIETEQDLSNFFSECGTSDLFLHVIPTEENIHPAVASPSIIFIRNISTSKTYYFCLNHPDSQPDISKEGFIAALNGMMNKKWVLDKKSFSMTLAMDELLDANLVGYLKDNSIIELNEYDTPAHFLARGNSFGHKKVNLVIPLVKHLEVFDELADDVSEVLKNFEMDTSYVHFNNLIIETLGNVEREGIFVDRKSFNEHFEIDPGPTGIVHSQYNVYTSTGRPSNRFDGVNYAALNTTDGSRRCFRSRYGNDGRIVVIDYTAFHPRIICTLTKYPLSVDIDIYEYLGRLYFQKKELDETDIKNSKQITFRQLYGGVEDKYAHIKYLANLKTYINEQWKSFQENGYVTTPFFKRKLTTHHIEDPSPTKVFNYILQAVEGEIAIPKLKSVQQFLSGKRTKAVLYTYDAVLYDFHKDDGFETLDAIRKIMSFNGVFPMKTYIGETYQDLRLITL